MAPTTNFDVPGLLTFNLADGGWNRRGGPRLEASSIVRRVDVGDWIRRQHTLLLGCFLPVRRRELPFQRVTDCLPV